MSSVEATADGIVCWTGGRDQRCVWQFMDFSSSCPVRRSSFHRQVFPFNYGQSSIRLLGIVTVRRSGSTQGPVGVFRVAGTRLDLL